ncbi:hypothetical protein FJR48_02390 [Sulfurimonas lithotrophica]|uniref:Integral membrane protein n=1 Tax=Sulfurimonas lithotrophica TaxID=2590022 RepID=A0A5P8NYY6_9BACT|nr:hypothetical protein [Sulfurimonas lithotrophica]QFR48636.1 hypothetical protein FJR48_02390 [Sulfurimonas lithotrophica]
MKYKIIFLLILGLDALNLIFQTSQISISYRESLILYGDISLLQIIIKSSMYIFGHNDFSLRLPMIFIHLSSVILLFSISKHYIKEFGNRLWLVFIFVLLPGVLSSALVVDEAGLIIFGLLLFIWLYLNNLKKLYYLLLVSFVFLDNSYIYLFLALSMYGIHNKNRNFFIFNMIAFFISILLFGVDAHGSPKGHFLDSLALYAAIFSPIVFVYMVFVLYRRHLDNKRDVVWFISTTGFIVSVILSFRQNIQIEHFAPYLIVALPIAAQSFISSYRVRLKEFRKTYRMMFQVSLALLLLNTIVVIFNKELYKVLDRPKIHFVYKFHIAKELAQSLKDDGISCINTNYKMQNRLYFYGVTKCDKYKLSKIKNNPNNIKNVTISYRNRPIYNIYVTKINK